MKLRRISIVMTFLVAINMISSSQGAVNSGDLTLYSGETLTINTTDGTIKGSSVYNATLEVRDTVTVANMTFYGSIEFKSGSTVTVIGKNALVMTSLTGNIEIQTNINMTCSDELFNSTCLGGFTQSLVSEKKIKGDNVYPGGGRGAQSLRYLPTTVDTCIPGSSHGGRGEGKSTGRIGTAVEAYDTENTKSPLGGSAGTCVKGTGHVAGGGAIELVANQGSISIEAAIIASAQRENDTGKHCSGGSGGRIRLRAQKVKIHGAGKLIVDGGDPWNKANTFKLGGGAGGVIQIIASDVSLEANSSSLKSGSSGCPSSQLAQVGKFIWKVNETATLSNNTASGQFPPQDFVWPSRPTSTVSSLTTSPTTTHLHSDSTGILTSSVLSTPTVMFTDERVKHLLNQTRDIRASLVAGDQINETAIREVLKEHKSLTNSVTLNEETKALCLDMFEEYKIIVSRLSDSALVKEVIGDSFSAATNCLNEKNHEVWRQTREMPSLLATLEEILVATVQGNFSPLVNYTLTTKTTAVQVRQGSVQDMIMKDITLPDYSEIKEATWKGTSDSVLIPKEVVQKAKGNYTYIIVLYKDVESGLPIEHSNAKGVDNVSSLVMSCSLMFENKLVREISPPAVLTFQTPERKDREILCSYWNTKDSSWSPDGVTLEESGSNSKRTVCKTDHFTSFAVLMQHKESKISEEDKMALSIITYVGLGISTAALAITLIILLIFESLSTERHKIHTNLVFALLLAQVLFLSGITQTSIKVLCKIIAVFLHYFLLTAFTWMLVEGIHLYLKVVQVFRSENVRMVYYYVFGWCFPAVPVVITVSMKPDSYGNENICWLSMEDGTVWAFIGPVIAIIVINCFILFMVVKTVVSSASAVKSADHDHVKAGVKGLFVLMPILGVSWILGLFYVNHDTIVFQYAFAIINAFQGFLIFLVHIVFSSEVREAFRRQREKRALSKESDTQYNASFSVSNTDSAYTSRKEGSSNSFEKLKARLPLKLIRGSKVVQVQPASESLPSTETSFQVKRIFHQKPSNKLCVTDQQTEISSLNCPMEAEERAPSKQASLVSPQIAVRRKQRP